MWQSRGGGGVHWKPCIKIGVCGTMMTEHPRIIIFNPFHTESIFLEFVHPILSECGINYMNAFQGFLQKVKFENRTINKGEITKKLKKTFTCIQITISVVFMVGLKKIKVRALASYCWLDNPRVVSSILGCSSGLLGHYKYICEVG